jgi:enoyl-CoA hydratase/carnithine racemase
LTYVKTTRYVHHGERGLESEMSSDGGVDYELIGPVAWIGLNRTAKRNGINAALLSSLDNAVRRAHGEARVLIVFGRGLCFSAGLDLAEQSGRSPVETFSISQRWQATFTLLRKGPVPAIAALHGATIGGGLELAAACHLRVADRTTFFAMPEGRHGLYVGGGASVHVAALIGASRLADLMLTGRRLDAEEAERIGLVNYLTEPGGACAKAGELAEAVASMAPLSVLGILQALPRIQKMSEDDGLFVESLMAALTQTVPDATTRLAGFFEARGSGSRRASDG